jgi:imidazolonepropionase-like amidohydrolase
VSLKPWTARPTRNLSFINAKLIDPKDGAIHENVRLDLREGRIERMLKLTAPVTQPPSEAELAALKRDNIMLVDLAGKFVIPGLIDCHVHLVTPPGEDGLKVCSSH